MKYARFRSLRQLNRGLLFALGLLIVSGCDSEGSEHDEVLVSRFGESKSHNAGANCMSCHRSGGSGEGVFTIAGTVYSADGVTIRPGAVVTFYSEPSGSGDLVASFEVDAKGNFFSTQTVSFQPAPYAVVSEEASSRSMSTPLTNGACSSCHGDSVPVITIP